MNIEIIEMPQFAKAVKKRKLVLQLLVN